MRFRFRAGPCRVEVGFSCFILLCFACLFAGERAPAMLLSMLCHEGGHLLALGAFGAAPRQVALSALGCRMVLPPGPGLGGGQAVAASLAGPGANLLCFAGCALAGRGGGPFALASLALGGLHLLPIEPLDGGLALHRLLECWLSPAQAERASRWAGAALLVPLGALGFWVLLRTRYNYSLLALALYLMLYLVLGEDYTF